MDSTDKQINLTEENLSQSCILCQLLRTKTLAGSQGQGQKASNIFKIFFTTICLVSAEWM